MGNPLDQDPKDLEAIRDEAVDFIEKLNDRWERKVNIGILDDDVVSANQLKAILGRTSLKVLTYHDPEDFLNELRYCSITLLFLDLRLPKMDGSQVLSQIRKSYGYNMKVVVITGYAERDIIQKLIKLEISGILVKPLQTAKVIKLVEKTLLDTNHLEKT